MKHSNARSPFPWFGGKQQLADRWGIWSTAARGHKGKERDRRHEVVWASPRAAMPTLFTQQEAVA